MNAENIHNFDLEQKICILVELGVDLLLRVQLGHADVSTAGGKALRAERLGP